MRADFLFAMQISVRGQCQYGMCGHFAIEISLDRIISFLFELMMILGQVTFRLDKLPQTLKREFVAKIQTKILFFSSGNFNEIKKCICTSSQLSPSSLCALSSRTDLRRSIAKKWVITIVSRSRSLRSDLKYRALFQLASIGNWRLEKIDEISWRASRNFRRRSQCGFFVVT